MRGYLIVGGDGAPLRYIAETNHIGLRTLPATHPGVHRLGHRAPGVYRARDEGRGRLWGITVGPRVDPLREAARLERLAAEPAWTYHGQGRPGIAGYTAAMRAVEEAARLRKSGSKLLAGALRTLTEEVSV